MSEKQEFESAYFSWDDYKDLKSSMEGYGESVAHFDGVRRSTGNFGRTFINVSTDTSVRSEYNRSDLNYYRPSESTDKDDKGMMELSEKAYKKVGVVRSVIDMMGDFTTHGIRIVHPNKQIENFCKNWWKKVRGQHTTERIANTVYRLGNCPVKIRYAKVPAFVEQDWRKNYASDVNDRDDDIIIKRNRQDKRRIPFGYNILNPLTLEVIGGELSSFVGKPVYALKIGYKFRTMIKRMERMSLKNKHINDMLQVIPDSFKQAVEGGLSVVPLDQDKIRMLHYKKDDWKEWATPFLGAIMDNLVMLEKMHLADHSALDGAIANVRLWTLGSLDTTPPLLPLPGSINKLRNILAQVGNGNLDIVWGPDLTFKESESNVHNYLKPEKYQQVMSEIFAGLGVPPSLTGGSRGSNGFTNNVISMKTLIERLEYGRGIIVEFWEEQLKILQQAMGWRFPPKIVFDYKVLSDEAAEKAILIDLWDRDIIGTETILELCRRDPELEVLRVNREIRKIDSGSMPPKAGPYHIAEKEHELKKIILQRGGVAPSEVGLELEERKEGEKSPNEQMEETQLKVEEKRGQMRPAQTITKPKSPGGDGRPKNTPDKTQRKKRQDKPKSLGNFVDIFMWANEAQKTVADLLSPAILKHFNKKNLRSLTKEEVQYAEDLKFNVFAGILPYSEITHEMVYDILAKNTKASLELIETCEALAMLFVKRTETKPTLEEKRQIQSSAYALLHEED